jgi:hypothetical protein
MSEPITKQQAPSMTEPVEIATAPDDGGAGLTNPVEPFRLAKTAAVASFQKQLEEKMHLSPSAAAALASSIDDPGDGRRQLQSPGRVRVPGGTLRTITGRISALSVVPHLVNGRVVGATPYPASVHAGHTRTKFWAERDLESANGELILGARSKQDVVDALADTARELLAQNDLTDSVREIGVFLPITVVALTIRTKDEATKTVMSAVEGSSRTATTHRIVGISGGDVVYGSLADYRNARGRMQELMAKLSLPLDAVTADDLAMARAASIPASFIVGFEPDRPEVDLVDALDEYVAFLHLDPPKEWTEPAKENKLADAVVDELAAVAELSDAEAEWFAGMLAPDAARAQNLPGAADERAARILRKLTAGAHTPAGAAVGRGTKRFTLQTRASRNPKSLAAASLALRAFPSARKATTTILARTWSFRAFWASPWKATKRTPEELRDAALIEVNEGNPGASTLELAARATYYLVTSGALGTEEPGSHVKTIDGGSSRPADKRVPARLLEAVVQTPQGVHYLYQAVVNGRLGAQPPRVDSRGIVVMSAAGSPIVATNGWMREAFRSLSASTANGGGQGRGGRGTGGGTAVVPSPTPEHALDAAINALDNDVDTAVARMKEIEGIPAPGGGSYVATAGIDSARAQDLVAKLDGIIRKVTRYELVWEAANPDLAKTDADDLDEDVERDETEMGE